MTERFCELVQKPVAYVRQQERDFKAVITHNAANTFTAQLSLPYDSLYILALGANEVQLGFINTIFMMIRSIISTPTGWLVDNYRLRNIFFSGVGLFILVPLLYALAHDWWMILVAMIVYALAMVLAYTSCSVVCASSLDTSDRATGKNLCNVFSSFSKILAPILGSFLITIFGGLTLEGIRPMYYVQIICYTGIFVFMLIMFRKSLQTRPSAQKPKTSVFHEFMEVFEGQPLLKRWILISGLIWMPYALITPYIPVFAYQFKGADQYSLGLMISAGSLIPLIFGIPLGRLADRVGRKTIIFLITPLYYSSLLLLILAPNQRVLILSGFFQGFYMTLMLLTGTMTSEMVPIEQMGRWMGIVGLFRGLFSIPAPLLGGLIWTHFNPMYVFLIPIILDLFLRLPLLATIPETLNSKIARSQTNHTNNN